MGKATKSFPLIIGMLLVGTCVFAQVPSISLSQKHIHRLDKLKSPEKRLKKYKAYYTKDSIAYVKNLNKYWRIVSDSIGKSKAAANEMMSKGGKFSEEGMRRIKNSKAGKLSNSQLRRLQKLQGKIPNLTGKTNGITGKVTDVKSDLLNNNVIEEGQELKDQAGQFTGKINQVGKYGDMTPDSLLNNGVSKLSNVTENRLAAFANLQEYQKEMNRINEIKGLQDQYKNQIENVGDSSAMKAKARQKAEEMALGYLEKNPKVVNAAEKTMAKLMKKYSFVPNSNDLSTAVKRTSLKGKTFRERLVIATNFQVLNINPFSIDLAPQLGYRFNSRLTLGLGGTYRQTFSDSLPAVSPQVFGYKAFVSFDAIKSFFVYGEFDNNSPGLIINEGIAKRSWKAAAFIGAGRRFSIHKKLDMTVSALYDILHQSPDPIYPRPFIIRMGFQLSDVAMLKKKPEIPKW
jgi:hypothetical protein